MHEKCVAAATTAVSVHLIVYFMSFCWYLARLLWMFGIADSPKWATLRFEFLFSCCDSGSVPGVTVVKVMWVRVLLQRWSCFYCCHQNIDTIWFNTVLKKYCWRSWYKVLLCHALSSGLPFMFVLSSWTYDLFWESCLRTCLWSLAQGIGLESWLVA